jgi:hypothetical protein
MPASPAKPTKPLSDKKTPATPTSSAKRAKFAHPRATKAANLVTLMPGIEAEPKSFKNLEFWEKEGELTGYCGFLDIADLRRFAISPYTLSFYNVLATTGKTKPTTVLELLRDSEQELSSEEDPVEQYPKEEDGSYADWRWALTIAQMYRTIQKALSKEAIMTQAELDAAHSRFETVKKKKPPTLNIEDEISMSHVPHWMRPDKPKVAVKSPAPDTPLLQTGRPALDVKVSWNYKSKMAKPAD